MLKRLNVKLCLKILKNIFRGPQGERGMTGEQGISGDQGPSGKSGLDGPHGRVRKSLKIKSFLI